MQMMLLLFLLKMLMLETVSELYVALNILFAASAQIDLLLLPQMQNLQLLVL